MAESIIGGRAASDFLTSEIIGDGAGPSGGLQIHINNYQSTLSNHFSVILPVTAAFVGDVFLRTSLKHYLRDEPPSKPQLSEYGGNFSEYLKNYKACETVPFISDLVRLEWSINKVLNAPEQMYPTPETWPTFNFSDLRLSTAIEIIASDYPLLSLWMAGNGQLPAESVNPNSGGQIIAVVRTQDNGVELYSLTQEERSLLKRIDNKTVSESEIPTDFWQTAFTRSLLSIRN